MIIVSLILFLLVAVVIGFCVNIFVKSLGTVMGAGTTADTEVAERLKTYAEYTGTGRGAKVPELAPSGPIDRLLVNTEIGRKFSRLVKRSGVTYKASDIVSAALLAAAVLFLIGTFIGSALTGLVLGIGALVLPYVWLQRQEEKILKEFRNQLPEAFTLMSNALSSGSTLTQSLEHAVKESRPPIKDELQVVVEQIGIGIPLDEALEDLQRRIRIPELDTVIAALLIQRRAGGNLAQLLGQATEIVREKIKLRNDLMVQTAQTRFSGKVVGLLPVVVIAGILLIDPTYIQPLFSTALGLVLLTVAAIGEILGFVLINKILAIDI